MLYSTVSADALVEVPKLYNIKLLIAFIHTLIIIIIMNIFNFTACKIQNRETQRVGNDRRS